ncbi:YaaL family protein [Metallumcola ferriviriculae]|uniref:YaaL family protein n=1 Tax=Metallumcola ferriviriculae TaxID=3039180 RepID=A0AAU0UJY1_9FIRM|nr:YaaL family protein [Desulfitibacteraceae bacterium MK1]
MKLVKKIIETITGENLPLNPPQGQITKEQILDQAKREWEAAQNIFNEATEKDLVDYAIFEMQATERRYMHLLKKNAEESERN